MEEDFGISNLGLPIKLTKKNKVRNIEDGFKFEYPPMNDPTSFFNGLKNTQHKNITEVQKGTTTLAFRFKEGIIVAVDSRSSMGNCNSSENVKKILDLDENFVATMAGGAADCYYFLHRLANQVKIHEYQFSELLSGTSISKFLQMMMFKQKGQNLSAGCMLISKNKEKGCELFYVDHEANRLKGNMFSVGSGSSFAYTVLEANYKWDMTKEQAYELGKLAISQATGIDAASGGVTRVHFCDNEKIENLCERDDNNNQLWNRLNQKNKPLYDYNLLN